MSDEQATAPATNTGAAPDTATADALRSWIGECAGGQVTQFERGVVRREAYLAAVQRSDGSTERFFVRVGRPDDVANSIEVAMSEAKFVAILAERGLPVAQVVGTNAALGAAMYSWVDGIPEVESTPVDVQQRLCEQYVEALADLHRLDHRAVGVDWMAEPSTPDDIALAHADAIYDAMGSLALEPLSTFGITWLHNHVPSGVPRLSLLHGDAGVGNFLFVDDQMQGIIDWEWAHLGDPMEDLGSLCMHASFHPAAHIPSLLEHYESVSGIAVDVAKVKYYCAHLYVRSVIALAAICEHLDPHNPVALNLAYRIINDRLTCEAIADALGVTLQAPDFPEIEAGPTNLYDVVAANLRADVVPALREEFPRNRAEMAAILTETAERLHRLGPTVEQIECGEIAQLLGEPVANLQAGLVALDNAITAWGQEREVEVLRYLYRRAWRAEKLYAPVVGLFPETRIRPIDR